MDAWDADIVRPIVIGAAITLAMIVGERTRAARAGDENRLRPTIFSYLTLALFGFAFLALLVIAARGKVSSDQIGMWYGFLVGLCGLAIAWYWYFHLRVVYWSADGVGVKTPHLPGKYVPWDEVSWAGRTWSGDLLIRSSTQAIRFCNYDGGWPDLVSAVKTYAPQAAVHFDE